MPTSSRRPLTKYVFLALYGTLAVALGTWSLLSRDADASWGMHAIDHAYMGADGTRLGDVNQDGLPDIATGWEQSGVVRVAINPGAAHARQAWSVVTVGTAPSVEDAVFADVDGDGAVDVISSAERDHLGISIHWAPAEKSDLLDEAKWQTAVLPVSQGKWWMFALPVDLYGKHGLDVVAGSKEEGAGISILSAPENPRDMENWTIREIYRGGWIMSLVSADLDDDGDPDIVASDRRGERSGVLWLENPGDESLDWVEHRVGPMGESETMFLDVADLNDDGLLDIVAAIGNGDLQVFESLREGFPAWTMTRLAGPRQSGKAKAVAVGDMDCDGLLDLVVSYEKSAKHHGVMGLYRRRKPDGMGWVPFAVSGLSGTKYDLINLLDLDADGDLDVLTSEEKALGVVWYENPLMSAANDQSPGNACRAAR